MGRPKMDRNGNPKKLWVETQGKRPKRAPKGVRAAQRERKAAEARKQRATLTGSRTFLVTALSERQRSPECDVPKRVCAQCGHPNDFGNLACFRCATMLTEVVEITSPAPQPMGPPPKKESDMKPQHKGGAVPVPPPEKGSSTASAAPRGPARRGPPPVKLDDPWPACTYPGCDEVVAPYQGACGRGHPKT